MKRQSALEQEFVEFMPPKLAAGKLYISMEYATASHLCCCGCGERVVTPFSPTDWSMTFNGRTVSLSPSIGNWSFRCRSHYWIKGGRVEWAGNMSDEAIEAGRRADRRAKDRVFGELVSPRPTEQMPSAHGGLSSWLRGLLWWK